MQILLYLIYKRGWFTVRLFALITHQTIILALFFSFVFVSLCTHIRALRIAVHTYSSSFPPGRETAPMQKFAAFITLSKTERHTEI